MDRFVLAVITSIEYAREVLAEKAKKAKEEEEEEEEEEVQEEQEEEKTRCAHHS